jgi:hypothetical protein
VSEAAEPLAATLCLRCTGRRRKAQFTLPWTFAWRWSLLASRSAKTNGRKMKIVPGCCNFPGSTPGKHGK